MAPLRPLLLALAATLSLAACVPADTVPEGRSASEPAPEPKPPVLEPNAPVQDPVMTCDTSNTAWAIGKLADEPMVTRIRTETHSKGVRVIKPGMAVTMDYREDRVNIDVDADNRILRVRCG